MSIRDEILAAAFHLFYKNGFHAVGVDAIADKVGITRQTLYNHFESRDALILEVIRCRDEWWRTEFVESIRKKGGEDALAQIRCIGPVLSSWLVQNEFQGCLFISAAAEFPNPADPAHRTAKRNLEAIRSVIEELAHSSGLLEPKSFAHKFVVIIQGAIITEVIERQHESGPRLCELAELLIDSHLPTCSHR